MYPRGYPRIHGKIRDPSVSVTVENFGSVIRGYPDIRGHTDIRFEACISLIFLFCTWFIIFLLHTDAAYKFFLSLSLNCLPPKERQNWYTHSTIYGIRIVRYANNLTTILSIITEKRTNSLSERWNLPSENWMRGAHS